MSFFKHTSDGLGFTSAGAVHVCPRCKRSDGGLIYTGPTLPTNCELCYFEKTGKRWNPYFDEDYLAKVERDTAKWKEFTKECHERSERWRKERLERKKA